MSYTVTLSARDVETLRWLRSRGYDGGFYDLADRVDPNCPDCSGEGCDTCDAMPCTFTLAEPQAWEFQENVGADPHAFLACNGSETLSEALHALLVRIV